MGLRGAGFGKAAVVACLATGLAAGAESPLVVEFTASNGGVLRAPSLDALSCEDVVGLLDALDALSYREIGPEAPTDPRDVQIFEYEVAVARFALQECEPTAPPKGASSEVAPR